MQEMSEHTLNVWSAVLLVILALALVGLLAYARGDDSDSGRSPERDSVSVSTVV